jgi:hypothetical protein
LAQAIVGQEGPAGFAQAQRELDDALKLAPAAGETPASPYDAALRGVDPRVVELLRGVLAGQAAR